MELRVAYVGTKTLKTSFMIALMHLISREPLKSKIGVVMQRGFIGQKMVCWQFSSTSNFSSSTKRQKGLLQNQNRLGGNVWIEMMDNPEEQNDIIVTSFGKTFYHNSPAALKRN